MRYWLALICLLQFPALAQDTDACANEPQCAPEQTLSLSLALGYGERSNPLYDGEEFPLVLLPDIYYYGKYWIFDNGKLGTSWALSDQWQLSLVSRLNQEKGYFQKWFSGNVLQFSHGFASQPTFQAERAGPSEASVLDVSKRPTALDGGFQLDWFGQNWQVQGLIWQDISNTYHGQHASIGAARSWKNAAGFWQLSTTLYWKSAKLIDTYYGIDNNDPFYISRYNGKPSWQPELRLSWQKPLTENFALLAFLRYLHLDDAMTDSPLVRTNNVTTWFFGISYRLL